MAIKYHVNPETNRPNQCNAKIRCDFAVDGQEPPHFSTKSEAKAYAEEQLTQEHGETRPVKKKKYAKSTVNVDEAIANKIKSDKIGSTEHIEKMRTVQNIDSWRTISQLQKNIEKDEAEAQKRLSSYPHYEKAEKWIEEAKALGSKTPEELQKLGMSGSPEAYVHSRAGQAEREYNLAKRTGTYVSNSNTYYGNINVLAKEIEEDKFRNEQEAGFLLNNAEKNKAVYNNLRREIFSQTGYKEDPVYGIPSGEQTFDKWKGKSVRGYSSKPTKNVEILKDSQSVCKNCGEILVKVSNGNSYYKQHKNGDYKCANGKTFISESSKCTYCGTSNPAFVEFKQQSYSDEVHCQRCGGVDGHGIGD